MRKVNEREVKKGTKANEGGGEGGYLRGLVAQIRMN